MSSQLGPALAAVGAPNPARIEWFDSVMDVHTHSH
jgi:hypothetical protein